MPTNDLAKKALRDIWAFADLINFRGGQKSFYQLHREMAEINCRQQLSVTNKREYRRRIFLVPREHWKSTVNTVLYCLWRIYRNPNIRILVGSSTKDLAEDFIREMRAYLEDEELIETVWNNRPHISGALIPKLTSATSSYKKSRSTEAVDSKVIWSASALQVNRTLKDKQPTLMSVSVGMSVSGKHCDLVVLDDIVTYENSDTEAKANKIFRWTGNMESVLDKKPKKFEICSGFWEYVGGELLINGTRYYAWDYYSHLVGNSEEEAQERLERTGYSAYIKSVYKNGVDNSDGYLCPQIFDEEVEYDIVERESMTSNMFAAQFMNKIVTDVDQALDTEMIKTVIHFQYKRTEFPNTVNYIDSEEQTSFGATVYPIRIRMTIDLATGESTDKAGYCIGGYDEKRRLHVVAAKKEKWKPAQHYEAIYKAATHWKLSAVTFEGGVGYQDTFRDGFKQWMKVRNLPMLAVHTTPVIRSMSKNDRIERTLQPLFESGRLFISSNVMNNKDLTNEIRFFNPKTKKNADDLLDMIEMLARLSVPTQRVRGNPDRSKYRHLTVNKMYGGTRA